MLKIRYQVKFKKDYKRAIKRGYNKKLFEEVLFYLVNENDFKVKKLNNLKDRFYIKIQHF